VPPASRLGRARTLDDRMPWGMWAPDPAGRQIVGGTIYAASPPFPHFAEPYLSHTTIGPLSTATEMDSIANNLGVVILRYLSISDVCMVCALARPKVLSRAVPDERYFPSR